VHSLRQPGERDGADQQTEVAQCDVVEARPFQLEASAGFARMVVMDSSTPGDG
jgi:hypothetical protein